MDPESYIVYPYVLNHIKSFICTERLIVPYHIVLIYIFLVPGNWFSWCHGSNIYWTVWARRFKAWCGCTDSSKTFDRFVPVFFSFDIKMSVMSLVMIYSWFHATDLALSVSKLKEFTGREKPTVITWGKKLFCVTWSLWKASWVPDFSFVCHVFIRNFQSNELLIYVTYIYI